jgi:RNA recognition motif-containing protein
MNEDFLNTAMMQLGQDGVVSIKVMTNKFTGEPAGYGFINFDSDQRAILTMHRLGGKVIPNSNPPVRFKLNHNSTRLQPGEGDTSIWVGDLTPDVDDYALYQFFSQRYTTVRCAKVVLDESGFSKGYGFVRFGSESEQQHALANMTGELGVGSKPIKVSMANQKNRASGSGPATGAIDIGGRNHQNGSANWGGPLDPPVGTANGPGVSANPGATGRGTGDSGWPGMQSPPTAAAWNQPAAAPAHIAAAAAHPDFSTYQHYYSQYAQQFSQQQQQYAAAWSAWQQQQP